MSYNYDKLHLDMIEASQGENTDVVINLDGNRYKVVGVEPEPDTGCLQLKLWRVGWPTHWPYKAIGDHLRNMHGFRGVYAKDLPDSVDLRLAEHYKDHEDDNPKENIFGMGHIHPDPHRMDIIEEV